MHQNPRILISKALFSYPFRQSSNPISSYLASKISTISPSKTTNFNPPISKICYILHQIRSNPSTQFSNHENFRRFSSEPDLGFDKAQEIDEINLKFAEAREEIEMALESKETVYFDEEAESARTAVKAVLDMFEGLSSKLPEGERAGLQRSMGLKIEQLKAELQQLND
eukprot:TRINITY_DN22091_c0_g1_i1.p1 TRINITY_DN22091_c0_g1~~TRINITY_DN22091_c0_g1_i1.p1  ORF type:complete len:169 (-),score=25.15 TRINITY_DN22091_c0_g1_i1:91-597(-)